MKPEVAAALEASIRHWEENMQVADLDDAKLGHEHCALCLMFFSQGCHGCPVRDHTGATYCRDTPYQEASDLAEYGPLEDFIAAAEAELEFLKSLREENGDE